MATKLSDKTPIIKQGYVAADLGGAGKTASPGYVLLKDSAGVSYYLFVTQAGKLRISTTEPTADTDGALVGTQS